MWSRKELSSLAEVSLYRCCYKHVTVRNSLHLCYCMFVTIYIITRCNVKDLCVSLRSVFTCFACYSRQQAFIRSALTAWSLWWKYSVFSVVYQPIYGALPKCMETIKHYHGTQPYICYTLHCQTLGNIWINNPGKNPSINWTNTALHLVPSEYSTQSLSSMSPISARYSLYHTAFTPVLHYKYTNV